MELHDVSAWFYPIAAFAVLITGISKSGFSSGVGSLSVPIMAIAISPLAAAAIMLPILCFMDLMTIWAYRRQWDKRNLLILLPGAMVGIVIGALIFDSIDENMVRLILGLIALLFALNYFVSRRAALKPRRGHPAVGVACGTVAGITSFIAHAGGPPVQFFMLPQHLHKSVFVGTSVILFFAINQAKIIPYALIGQFSAENLTTALVLAPMAPIGIFLGLKLHKLVSQELFYKLSYGMMVIAAVKLLWDGIAGMVG